MSKKIVVYVLRESKYEFDIPDEMTSEDEGFTDLMYETIGGLPESFVNMSVTAYDNGTQVY